MQVKQAPKNVNKIKLEKCIWLIYFNYLPYHIRQMVKEENRGDILSTHYKL